MMNHLNRIGRKKVAMASCIGVVAFGIGSAFSINVIMFMILRFFVAFFIMGLFTVGFTYGKDIRTKVVA